jgi:hypothetical protein
LVGLVLLEFLAGSARATVDSAGESGFQVKETAHVAAGPGAVYAVLIVPSRWWDPVHTYSQNASNLSLDAKAGGCWCESLPDGGSVLHTTVVNVRPGRLLRLHGALGPLQGMAVDGAMTIMLTSANGGTDVTLTYTVGGYAKDGFATLADAVDEVLGEQISRLKQFIEAPRK